MTAGSIRDYAAIVAAIVCVLIWVRPGAARAGIVNVQSAVATPAKEGTSGSITGSVDWRTGNRTRLWFSLAPVLQHRSGPHVFIGIVSGFYYRDTDDLKVFEHVRYRYHLGDRWLLEGFGQHEYNEKRLLLLRALVGFGPRYQAVKRKKLQIGVGVAYMAEYEVLKELDDLGPVPAEESPLLNHRISTYLTGSYDVDDRLQLAQTLYAQPLMSDVGDIRLLSESVLVIRLSKTLALRTSFVLS